MTARCQGLFPVGRPLGRPCFDKSLPSDGAFEHNPIMYRILFSPLSFYYGIPSTLHREASGSFEFGLSDAVGCFPPESFKGSLLQGLQRAFAP